MSRQPVSMAALLSLSPRYQPMPLEEPKGHLRRRVQRQFSAFEPLAGRPWHVQWRLWQRTWPALSRDPDFRQTRLRLFLWLGVCALAGPLGVVLGGPPLEPMAAVWRVPLVTLACVLVLGLPAAILVRRRLQGLVESYLKVAGCGES